jgi:hypothetical protein
MADDAIIADGRLHRLAAQSFNTDKIIIEMLYCDRVVTFDIPFMEAKYVAPSELFRRYFVKAFAAINVPIEGEEIGETHASALSSSSQPNV